MRRIIHLDARSLLPPPPNQTLGPQSMPITAPCLRIPVCRCKIGRKFNNIVARRGSGPFCMGLWVEWPRRVAFSGGAFLRTRESGHSLEHSRDLATSFRRLAIGRPPSGRAPNHQGQIIVARLAPLAARSTYRGRKSRRTINGAHCHWARCLRWRLPLCGRERRPRRRRRRRGDFIISNLSLEAGNRLGPSEPAVTLIWLPAGCGFGEAKYVRALPAKVGASLARQSAAKPTLATSAKHDNWSPLIGTNAKPSGN